MTNSDVTKTDTLSLVVAKKVWSMIYYRCTRPSQNVTQFGDQAVPIMVKGRQMKQIKSCL